MSTTTRKVIWAYVIVGVLTLIFEIYVRLPQCSGTSACAVSFGKGVIWSIVWPLGWIVYLKGMF